MANFDYRKALKKNKSTFFSSLTEGQFSWMTQDTDNQIGSEPENTITVYMHDNKGNTWREDNYQGYGEFGGMDYYELLAKMNGYTEDDIERLSDRNIISFPELRNIGVKVAFGDLKPLNAGPVLFPALTEDPRYPSGHDFTEEAENDPNQSWYTDGGDYDDTDYFGNDDDDDDDLYEGKDEMSAEEKANVFVREAEGEVMVDAKSLSSYIDEMVSLADDMDYTPAIIKSLKGLKSKLSGKMSVKDALDFVKKTIDITGDDIDAIEALGQATKYNDAVIAKAKEISGIKENKSNKMTKKELKEIIKSALMNEIDLDIDKMEDAPESEVDFLSETQNREVLAMADMIMDALGAEKFVEELILAMSTNEAKDNLEHIIQMYDLEDYSSLREAEEEVETEEEVDVDVEDPEPTDEPTVDGGIDVTQNADADLTGVEKEVQDNLEAAMEAAKKLNDEKLQQQIGNSLTFFTRQHVVKENNKKYYKDAEADDAEHIKALEKDMKDDKKSSKELKETLLLQKRAGIITESQYKAKLKEAEEVSPEQAADKAIAMVPKLEKSPEIDKLADKIANDPKMLQQLEKALAKGGVMMNENMGELDNSDLKTLALNFAKQGEKMNEGISNNPNKDDTSAGLAMLSFLGGGTLGAMFSSAIGAAVPALATAFAGPAVAAALAGVALFVLARKVYLKMNPDV